MASEIVIAERWLNQTLTGDAALAAMGVHGHLIPKDAALPAIVFVPRPGLDLVALGGARVFSTLDYIVKGVCQAESLAPLVEAVTKVDALLHGKSGAVTGGRVLSCIRVQPIAYPETSQGKQYRHLGGVYRLQVQEEE
jgi:hypothetical protein